MANNPFPGGPPGAVGRDEPNKRGGTSRGNQGEDREQGDLAGPGNFADSPETGKDALVRGAPPKPRKRYSLSG
ncbi:hypothetical protein E8L99_04340 [Phreatobacter aquaticus]|uniref:Uncharacterized protein n=1 Tax=Phreatobacter aquaticus TaxID=2570229 RepID=A0A4D7QER4_9HYPH|nr:hypothetical protein [Phreatobacter aquaticus]QCK85061.1 hypothetical protein E8L99_04340 [Phreatobacter aquaticus]